MRSVIFGRDENGRRWGGKLRFTLAEGVASTGLLLIAIGVTMAVLTLDPLALVPGITYAIAVGMALMVYRHYLRVRLDAAAADETAKGKEPFQTDVQPLLEGGWEDEFAASTPPEWVDMPAVLFPAAGFKVAAPPVATFKVVGSRGICPKGVGQGDFVEVTASGPVTPGLCPAAEAVLHMAAKDNSEVREWCCPVYDHLLVFKKLNKIT